MTSRSKTNRAGCWPAAGCRRAGRDHDLARAGSGAFGSDGRARPGAAGHRNRPSAVGAGVVGGRLCGVCDQPVAGGPVSGTAFPSGAKSDPGDAHLLAEIVRLDRAHHRRIAGDSQIAEHVKIAARAHQSMIWSRVRQVNTLRSLLREYYPAAVAAFGTDLAGRDALAVLTAAPNPDLGRRLSQSRIETLLRRAGRQRNVSTTAATIRAALSSEQLAARPGVIPAYTASASALLAVEHDGGPDRGAGWAGGAGF
jgi:Transposase